MLHAPVPLEHLPAVVGELITDDRCDRAIELLDEILAGARPVGAVSATGWALALRALAALRLGRVNAAYIDASTALGVDADVAVASALCCARAVATFVNAVRGQPVTPRPAAGSPELCRAIHQHALGIELLLAARHADALECLAAIIGSFATLGGGRTPLLPVMPDAVEAAVKAGMPGVAAALFAHAEPALKQGGGPVCRAGWNRARLLLCPADELDRLYDAASAELSSTNMPLEAARIGLICGQRLRRDRRSRAARQPLRKAISQFDALGCWPWATEARSELFAAGAEVPPPPSAVQPPMTPREEQIARFVSNGRTNREIAEALFVSQKTVEYHLTHIYRKLSLRSRTELARQVLASSTALPSLGATPKSGG